MTARRASRAATLLCMSAAVFKITSYPRCPPPRPADMLGEFVVCSDGAVPHRPADDKEYTLIFGGKLNEFCNLNFEAV